MNETTSALILTEWETEKGPTRVRCVSTNSPLGGPGCPFMDSLCHFLGILQGLLSKLASVPKPYLLG